MPTTRTGSVIWIQLSDQDLDRTDPSVTMFLILDRGFMDQIQVFQAMQFTTRQTYQTILLNNLAEKYNADQQVQFRVHDGSDLGSIQIRPLSCGKAGGVST